MLYIKEDVKPEELKKFGFKKCKKPYDMLYDLITAGLDVMYVLNETER